MNQIFIFILGVAIGAVAIWFFVKNKNSNSPSFNLIQKQAQEKAEHLKKILEALERKSFGTAQDGNARISNNDVEKLAGVSHATAERYLDELEKKG